MIPARSSLSVCLSVGLSVRLSVCLSVCLSACLSVWRLVGLSGCLSVCPPYDVYGICNFVYMDIASRVFNLMYVLWLCQPAN